MTGRLPDHASKPNEGETDGRRTQMALTAVGMVILGAMEVYLPSAAQTSDTTKIVVKDFMFDPTPLTVRAGSTVTWTNMDDEPHTVVSDTGAFKSGGMDTNDSFSYKFDKPGTYHFTCSCDRAMG